MQKLILSTAVFFLSFLSLQAQVCTGSLGDPTVSITFGNQEEPPTPLDQSHTSYLPASGGCPAPGEYGFRSLLFNCYDNTWFTLVGDHTANDHDGQYLLVNAAGKRGTFYTDQVDGLCPNTTYEISVWIANVLKKTGCGGSGIEPNVTLQVETAAGNVLGTYNTGSIFETDELQWKQYSTTFKTDANTTSVIFRIINNVDIGDCGNIIAIDDIAFRPCGPSINAVIEENNSEVINVCEGNNISFTMKASYSAGFTNPVFQWQESFNYGDTWQDIPGETSVSLIQNLSSAGVYYYRFGIAESSNAQSLDCRIYSNPLKIFLNSKPFVQITSYIFGCFGERVVIFAAGGSTYEWTGPNGFISTLERPVIDSADYADQGRYNVKITTSQGCSDTASLNLLIYPAAHATIGSDVSICEGSSINLIAGGGIKYKWSTDIGALASTIENDSVANPLVTPTDTTSYNVTVYNEYGCTDTASVTVNVWKKPSIDAGPDKRIRIGLPVTLDGSAEGTDIRYFWTPSAYLDNANSLKPVVNPPASAYYTLHGESNKGCGSAMDEVFIKVYDKIIIPNAFSPNRDGINDTWNIEPLDLFTDADLQVYNRYGQLVFRNIGYIKPWNGTRNNTSLPVGTYYYILDLKIKGEKPMTGVVTLLR